MRVILFTENSYCGGLDSFLVSLINLWPAEDDLVLVCNQGHPGLKAIERRAARPLTIIGHAIRPPAEQLERIRRLPGGRLLAKALSPVIRFAGFPLLVGTLGRLLAGLGGDRLMVVNGGYPGGDTCRAATMAWARLGKVPAIHNVHNLAIRPRWWESLPEALIDRAVAKASGRMVAVSKACAKALDNRPGLSGARTQAILNGIPPQPDGLAAPVDVAAPYILMLGTYEPRKGHDFLFAAFARVARAEPNVRLVTCGFGYAHDLARVEDLARRHGITERVTILGFRDDVPALIAHAHGLAISSQEFESFGLTAVEAMAQGVPVVATRVGGLPEVVGEDGCAGWCVERDDVDGFAARLLDLLADPALRARMGAMGRERYQACFTAERMAGEYRTLLYPEHLP